MEGREGGRGGKEKKEISENVSVETGGNAENRQKPGGSGRSGAAKLALTAVLGG